MTHLDLKEISSYAEQEKDKELLILIDNLENATDIDEEQDAERDILDYWEDLIERRSCYEDDRGDYLYCLANDK